MLPPRFLVAPCLLALALLCPAIAHAQTNATPPSHRSSALQRASALPVVSLGTVDDAQLRAEDARGAGTIRPYRYGVARPVSFSPRTDGVWETLPSGASVWRLRIFSRGAHSLSLGFSQFRLPAGAQLFVHGPHDDVVRGPYSAADATQGALWTPHVKGAELVVELVVPEGQRDAVDLAVEHVAHAYRPVHPAANASAQDATGPQPKAGACNVDVACEEADPWRNQVRSVALYTFRAGTSMVSCTGSLLNNTSQDRTPYFLTANHCLQTQQQATSAVFYWNYQNPTCRPPGSPESGRITDDDPTDQTSSGALLRATFGSATPSRPTDIFGRPDVALLEVDETIPERYDIFFAGWSRAETAPRRGISVHHPNGDGKRIAIDDDPLSITPYGQLSSADDTHLRVEAWEVGTTERGSSGAPLYDQNGRVVGLLSGGFARCSGTGADDNNEPDWYGRIAEGWTGGGTEDSQLKHWLDPAGTNPMTLDGLGTSDDQQVPGPIRDLRVDSVAAPSASITLQWIAPGDDGDDGVASQYDIRYSTAPITTDAEFEAATQLPDPPAPQPAGTRQTYTARVPPGATYFFAVRSFDEARNASPIAATSMGAPLPDVIAPSAVDDLTVSDVDAGTRSITLRWTAVGDDGTERQAAAYDLRYDTTPIRTVADFEQATPASDLPTPRPAGQQEQVTVPDLEAGVPYYFSLRVVDDAGNVSSLPAPEARPENAVIVDNDALVRALTPNPSRSGAALRLAVQETQDVTVDVYDTLGRRVQRVFDGSLDANRETSFALDTGRLAAGTYFVHIVGASFATTRTLSVVR